MPIQSSEDVKYIRITDFDDDGIVTDNEFCTAGKIDDRYLLSDGDILFARSGATVGKTFIYTEDIGPSIFAGYCIRFRFNKKIAIPRFIFCYTKTNRYQAWVQSVQRPCGQPNINKEEFKSFTVPVPPLLVQQEMVGEMEQARQSRRQKLEQADTLLSNLDAILLEFLGLNVPQSNNLLAYAVRLSLKDNVRIDPHYHHPNFVHLSTEIKRKPYKLLGDIVRAIALKI